MIKDSIIITIISFFICTFICPYFIPMLHKFKFGQQVRSDGPSAHLKKKGTATMGGIMILLSITFSLIPFIVKYKEIIPVLLFTLAFGIIGFLDDYLKVVKKKSDGLSPKQKFFLQLLISIIFVVYIYVKKDIYIINFLIPFTGALNNGIILKVGILFIPFAIFVILGTDNGVNFTDGLDGLCSSVTAVVSLFFLFVGIKENLSIAPINAAVFGALLGFLIYNSHPAKVFMGDTGSLALGAYVSGIALTSGVALFIPVVGFIYLIEVLSVIIQVAYFKKTKGKRIFKMAPIHHHFELSSYSETQIFTVFTITTIIFALISIFGMIS